MPSNTVPRKTRHSRLLKAYVKYSKLRTRRVRRQAKQLRRQLNAAGVEYPHSPLSSNSDTLSSLPSLPSSDSASSLSDDTSSLSSQSASEDSASDSDSEDDAQNLELDVLMAEVDVALADILDPMRDDLSESTSSDEDDNSGSGGGSGDEADIEEGLDGEEHVMGNSRPGLSRQIRSAIEKMYTHRYEEPRDIPVPRPPAQMPYVLQVLKVERPDHFREILRVNPATFDCIVDKIKDDPVFYNNSNNPQIPVEEQLAITLYRFGHDGSAAGHAAVARWAGAGRGSAGLHTKRVMTAILRRSFMSEAVRFPTEEEKEVAKVWVEAHSCKAWRNGWLLVDGSGFPLFNRPHWYGESYFDRKCNYSLNVQIVSLPNLRIIDFAYGHTGSAHDSTAWDGTRLVQEHETLLEANEFVWADSAYPVETWVVAPYKKPERDIPENEEFNTHVSSVRIKSEHAIGFLKGRFHSLKNLRVRIKDQSSHKFATHWVAACIGIHAFAMMCEDDERCAAEDSDDMADDPFIAQGLSSSSDEDSVPMAPRAANQTRLQAGKAKREALKRALFRAKERRNLQRAADISDSEEGSDVNN